MSFGMGKSDSNQRQEQGISGSTRDVLNKRIPSQFDWTSRLAEQGRDDPGGTAYMGEVDKLLPMGRYGMAKSADEGAMQMGRDMFTSAAGNRAQRGFSTPYNTEAVLGDAMRMTSAQLLPQSNAFALQRAQMAPQLRQAAFGYGTAPMQMLQQLVGGSGTGSGNSNSFGFNAAMAPQKGSP